MTDSSFIEFCYSLIEDFKNIADMNNSELLYYMNLNNVWAILDNTDIVEGLINCDDDMLVGTFGKYLSDEHKKYIIDKFLRGGIVNINE